VSLLALSAAIVYYLQWSSDANWAEFVVASQTTGLARQHRPHPAALVQAGKCQLPSGRQD
jgi:hypothetical protein